MTVNDIAEAVENTASTATDIAAGAAATVVEAISNPGRTAGRFSRKGAPARREVHREVAGAVSDVRETTLEVAGALLPERIAIRGLRLVKAQARRKDLVGELAYRGLDLVNGSLKEVASAITRLERASQPPARAKRSLASATRTSAKRATRTTTKRSSTATRRTSRTRRTTRRTAAA